MRVERLKFNQNGRTGFRPETDPAKKLSIRSTGQTAVAFSFHLYLGGYANDFVNAISLFDLVPPPLLVFSCGLWGQLPAPVEGAVVLTGTLVGDTATYSCNAGFVLFGKGIRDCHLDGTWSHKTPECRGGCY